MTHFQHIENLLDRAVGFDEMFNRLQTINQNAQGGYPPYNIIKDGDEKYAVEVAVAGFSQDEIEVELKDGNLIVSGKKAKDEGTNFIHKGIGTRAFTRTFTLSDDVVVRGADLSNGILVVELERIIPEEKKPRKIEIGANQSEKQFLSEDK